jgi:hypothetical protein
MEKKGSRMIIYFIQVEPDGAVKIGKTKNTEERLRTLQIGHHQKLKLLFSFIVDDDKADYVENHLHSVFADHRIRGEWFSPCPYMYDFINTIGEHGFWVSAMEAIEEYYKNDPFGSIYNEIYQTIKKAREYGDTRYLKGIVEDLKILREYAFTGKIN